MYLFSHYLFTIYKTRKTKTKYTTKHLNYPLKQEVINAFKFAETNPYFLFKIIPASAYTR